MQSQQTENHFSVMLKTTQAAQAARIAAAAAREAAAMALHKSPLEAPSFIPKPRPRQHVLDVHVCQSALLDFAEWSSPEREWGPLGANTSAFFPFNVVDALFVQDSASHAPHNQSFLVPTRPVGFHLADEHPVEVSCSPFMPDVSSDKAPEAKRCLNVPFKSGLSTPLQCDTSASAQCWKTKAGSPGGACQLSLPSNCKGSSRIPLPKGRSGSALTSVCSSSGPSAPECSSSVSSDQRCKFNSSQEDGISTRAHLSGIPSPSTFIAKRRRLAQALE